MHNLGKRCVVLACVLALSATSQAALAKKITLNWWIDHAPQEIPLFQKVAKAFEAKYPDVQIKISNMWGSSYYDKLMAAGSAGTMPDIYYMRGGSGDARFYARGLALDLSPYVKKDWAEINGSDFLDSQVGELHFLGKWMALPYDYSTEAIYYNKTMLAQAGVPMFGDFTTWNDFITAGLKITKTDASGKRQKVGFEGLPVAGTQWVEGMMLSEGAKLFDDKYTKCFLDSSESMRFFQYISDLVWKQGIAARPSDPGNGGFYTQKAAFHVDGSWNTIVMRKSVKFAWDVTSLPCSDPNKMVTSATGGSWAASRATKHPNEAWRLIKFLASPESTRTLIVDPIRSLPSRKSLLPEWSNNIKREGLDPKNADVFWLGVKKNGKNSPALPFDYKVVLDKLNYDLAIGKKGVDQICKAANQAMQIELDKAWKRNLLR